MNLPEAPPAINRLLRDKRGYPVPWFVDTRAPWVNGCPDFRVMSLPRLKLAIRERRCWVCGGRLRGEPPVFVAGPMCGVNRTSAEPPCHRACALWSTRACPFLSVPQRVRDERDLPPALAQAGIGITRNPGVVMLWTTHGYRTWRPPSGGILFDIGNPIAVEWFARGRAATREEVMHSLETGLPILLRQAELEGDDAVADLGRRTVDLMRYLPDES